MKLVDGVFFSETESIQGGTGLADETKEVNFDQDKCEVSLLCLGLF